MDVASAGPAATASRRRFPLPLLIGCGVAAGALGIAGPLTGRMDSTPGTTAMTVAFALTFGPLGVFVARRLPGHPLGRLMILTGVSAAVAALAVAWSAWLPAAWLSQWAWWIPLATVPVLLLLVPDGRLPSPRWWPLAATLVAGATVAALALAAAALSAPRSFLSTPDEAIPPQARVLSVVAGGAIAVVVLATGGVLAALVGRWRSASSWERGQLACLTPAAGLLVVGIVLESVNVPGGWLPAVVALPLGLTLAVLRYRLHDLDLHVHRGLVWLVLTAAAVAVYALVAAGLGSWLSGLGPAGTSVIAAGAVAAVLQPAERLAQRAVTRLLYGRRDDPYAVITELGRHLGRVRDPLRVLPEIAATIADGLRVPYAAVRMPGTDGRPTTVAEHGRWAGPPEAFAMVAHGEPVGELLVAPRREGEAFTAEERRVLTDLAGQAALAADAVRSAVALRTARDRLVLAREEERRRLRRELHDGVGSALVGARMLAEVARLTVGTDAPVEKLVTELANDLDACTAEVRALIDGLRPAALDDGLERALGGLTERFAGASTAVSLHVGNALEELPAAVEVAAYRIVAEALTNVAKHAGASIATVTVTRDERHLELRIQDDGAGMPHLGEPAGDGVGMASMHSRAEELGGQMEITSRPGRTEVRVLLPAETVGG